MGEAKRRKQLNPNFGKSYQKQRHQPVMTNKANSQKLSVGKSLEGVQNFQELPHETFSISPIKAWELNNKLKEERLSWFYQQFIKSIPNAKCHVTQVLTDIGVLIVPQQFTDNGQNFSLPVVCLNPESNAVKVMSMTHGEIVLASRFEKVDHQKIIKPQFFGCIRITNEVGKRYGHVARFSWDAIDYSDDEENSLIITLFLQYTDMVN